MFGLMEDLNFEISREIEKSIQKIAEQEPIFKLASWDGEKFVIGEAGELLDKGIPFKDRYPLNFRSIDEWSKLLGLNGGKVYGGLLYKGSKNSRNWISRFEMAMERF